MDFLGPSFSRCQPGSRARGRNPGGRVEFDINKPLQLFQRVSEFDLQIHGFNQLWNEQLTIRDVRTLRSKVNQAAGEIFSYVNQGEIAAARYNLAYALEYALPPSYSPRGLTSIAAQSLHGVDASSAPGGNVAGDGSDQQQRQRHSEISR